LPRAAARCACWRRPTLIRRCLAKDTGKKVELLLPSCKEQGAGGDPLDDAAFYAPLTELQMQQALARQL
jgi:hypothetical protein